MTRGHALRRLPGHPVEAGWLAPLLSVQTECDIAIHLVPAALGEALGRLSRRLRDFSAHRMLEAERGALGDVHVDIGVDSASALRERLARNQGRPLHLSVVATVRGDTHEALDARSAALQLGFASSLIGVEVTNFRHMAALMSTLPLGLASLGAGKLVDSTAAATCVPWIEAGCADPGGYRLGAAIRSGLPVRVAPFDTSRHPNPNVAVFAASGHGKSFAIGTLVLEAAVAGVNSVIIDPEGEYRALVTALGGRYLELAPGTDAAVNVFEGAGDDPEEAIAAVVDLVTVLCGDQLGDVERAVVDASARAALLRAAAEQRTPLLEDCLSTLEIEARPVAMVVRRFCTGGLGALFNRPTSLAVDSGVCAISLREMPPEHVAAATLIVARWLVGAGAPRSSAPPHRVRRSWCALRTPPPARPPRPTGATVSQIQRVARGGDAKRAGPPRNGRRERDRDELRGGAARGSPRRGNGANGACVRSHGSSTRLPRERISRRVPADRGRPPCGHANRGSGGASVHTHGRNNVAVPP